ncbi:alpha/beta hydrolase [Microbacterium mangrovi]|uniref:alpha/beta hydrolase n=1 Tax=Microbacterium mangrovi TaxID=1348253 RepID=UPI00068D2AC4|nr:alpha/beta hydrolase [Microbacterium mangrovi]
MTWHDTELFPFPDFELTGIEELTDRRRVRDSLVARLDGCRPLHIDVDIPLSAEAVPVVAWIHGGAWQWGSNKLHDGPVPSPQIREQLVEAGIAFAAIDYRLSGEAGWPVPLQDVKAGIRWLRQYAAQLNIDPDRVAVWGESAGGHLAALVATTAGVAAFEGDHGATDQPSEVIACVNWYGPGELGPLLTGPAAEPAMLLLGLDASLADEASPRSHVDEASAPMLLIHGSDDSIIPSVLSERLAAEYQRAGALADVRIVTGAGHAFAGDDPERYIAPSIAFLQDCFSHELATRIA